RVLLRRERRVALPAEIAAVARHARRALPGAGALGSRHAHLAGDQSGQPPELAGPDRHGDDRPQDLLQSEPLAEARRLLPTERLAGRAQPPPAILRLSRDRKSTRLNSSHVAISYAVFCLKKKKPEHIEIFV